MARHAAMVPWLLAAGAAPCDAPETPGERMPWVLGGSPTRARPVSGEGERRQCSLLGVLWWQRRRLACLEQQGLGLGEVKPTVMGVPLPGVQCSSVVGSEWDGE